MKEQEQAKELVEKFWVYAAANDKGSWKNAIQCAIIHCEEMIKEIKWWHDTTSYEETGDYLGGEKRITYWQSVLTQLKHLTK